MHVIVNLIEQDNNCNDGDHAAKRATPPALVLKLLISAAGAAAVASSADAVASVSGRPQRSERCRERSGNFAGLRCNAVYRGDGVTALPVIAETCRARAACRSICRHNEDPALLEQARVVAANELVLRAINLQKIAVVERLRDLSAIALAKGDKP